MPGAVSFEQLSTANLTVEAVYRGGAAGNTADDPLSRLLPCGNQGGFRYHGKRTTKELRMVLLYSSGADTDWPDTLDRGTGLFTYFGDNRKPGSDLHQTPRGGNDILRWVFEQLHATVPDRAVIPPFFLFEKAAPGPGRDVRFIGLAVPGAVSVQPTEDLVALWRTTNGHRFQNYRATFTVLDVNPVPRAWIGELVAGHALGPACPSPYRAWVEHAKYTPLTAPSTLHYRTTAQQQPETPADAALVAAVYNHFSDDPYEFEACAIELWKMQAKDSIAVSPTRRSADGGRDAWGTYEIGPTKDRVSLDFSLEAKCYAPGNGAGVKETSRLISRLRHRDFGVFVITSYVNPQAYRELREDRHPVVIICARDIADLLKQHGHGTPPAVKAWLAANFPHP